MNSLWNTNMKFLSQAAAITLFASSAAQAQQAAQWRVQDGGNGHWYAVDLTPLWWEPWNQRAAQLGARLASVTSVGEQQHIVSLIGPMSNGGYPQLLWLGGLRRQCSWSWTSGEPWGFTSWSTGNPNGGCLDAQLGIFVNQTQTQYNLGWDDCVCPSNGEPTAAILEWSTDCNNDGIVDYGQCRDGSLPDYNGNNIPDCCEAGAPCPIAARQWRTADGGNGHWYGVLRVSPSERPESLFTRASQLGGHAATIGSAMENSFCGQFVVAFDGMLIGLRKLAGTNQVAWITGEPVNFVNWRAGEGTNIPERYALMLASSATWQDTDLTPRQVVLVEFDADCNNDGIVDFGQIRDGTFPDSNGNGVPDCCEGGGSCCVGDILADRVINGADLGILLSQWGPSTPLTVSDINNDGFVNGVDLALLLAFWGACP